MRAELPDPTVAVAADAVHAVKELLYVRRVFLTKVQGGSMFFFSETEVAPSGARVMAAAHVETPRMLS